MVGMHKCINDDLLKLHRFIMANVEDEAIMYDEGLIIKAVSLLSRPTLVPFFTQPSIPPFASIL